jgi:hypothetical protein
MGVLCYACVRLCLFNSVVSRFLMAVSSDPTNAALHLRGLTVLAEVRTAGLIAMCCVGR